MQFLKEITVWDKVEHKVGNHTYAVSKKGFVVGYKPEGKEEWKFFSKPNNQFSKTRRKFIKLKDDNKYVVSFKEQYRGDHE